MTARYLQTLFGPAARALQDRAGSRTSYARMEARGGADDVLGEAEIAFLSARDSFYLATVTEDGWPYVQHRGGKPGFVTILGPGRIGFADYPGNRQYISLGNLATSDRVSLFFMDYPARRRLKLVGHALVMEPGEADAASPEASGRFIAIDIVGYDWNCPQYITPRFTLPEITSFTEELRSENLALRAEIERLKARPD